MIGHDTVPDRFGRGPIQRVEQLLHRDGGRPVLTGVLVGAGVGDDQGVGGRADGIEQQLPVLRTDVAFTRERTTGQDVVAVGDVGARKHAVVEADQAHHAVWHRAHRDHGAHRQRAGAEVGAGGTAGQLPLQQGPDVGQPQRRAGPRARLRQHFREFTVELRLLPLLVGTDPRELRDALAQHLDPALQRLRAGEPVDDAAQPLHVFGQPAGQFHAVRVDVVERQRGAQPVLRIVGHRGADQQPVDPELPRVLRVALQRVRSAVRRVETPPDTCCANPFGEVHQIVVGPGEAPAHRLAVCQAQHRTGGGPAVGDVEQFGQHAEQGIGLGQRAVGQPHPQALGRMAEIGMLTRAERRGDQWRVGLDIGAHDQDVARLQRFVVVEQAQQHITQDIDLPGRAVTAMDLHGPVGLREPPLTGPDLVGRDVGLQPAQQRVRESGAGMELIGLGGGQAALQLPQITAEGLQQRVPHPRPADVDAPRLLTAQLGQRLPQRVAGMRQPQVQIVVGGQGAEQFEVGRRQPGVPEQGQSRR